MCRRFSKKAGGVMAPSETKTLDARRSALTVLNEAKLRRERLAGDLLELKVKQAKGELLPRKERDRTVSEAYARVSSKLTSLPQKIAMRVTGATAAERKQQAQLLVDEVRAELVEGS
jgi:hypothetical protein